MRLWFCVDTLEYLQRGGRIGRAQAWLGGALQIKPILSIESEINPGRAGAHSRACVRANGRLLADAPGRRRRRWVVQHIQAPERAEALVARGRELFGSDPIWVSEVGPVIGTYTGPGLVGVGGLPSRLLA